MWIKNIFVFFSPLSSYQIQCGNIEELLILPQSLSYRNKDHARILPLLLEKKLVHFQLYVRLLYHVRQNYGNVIVFLWVKQMNLSAQLTTSELVMVSFMC